MGKKIEVIEEPEETSVVLINSLRRILLAGIGVIAVAQEEMDDFVNKLVERGEIAEKDARKVLNDVRERRQKTQSEVETVVRARTSKKAGVSMEKGVDTLLERLNVPTKSDINQLNQKITLLAEKVDALKKNSNHQ